MVLNLQTSTIFEQFYQIKIVFMKSQTPTWAIIVAILMMLIGGCGIKNDIQYINIREMLAMKDKIFDKMAASEKKSGDSVIVNDEKAEFKDTLSISEDSLSTDIEEVFTDTIHLTDGDQKKDIGEIKDMVEGFLDIPEATIARMVTFGYIGLFFSFLFILGGLFLLIKKNFSIQLAYAALGANVLFSISKWILLSGEGGGLLNIANSVGSAFSIVGCIILFVIIISCDKSYYEDIYTE